MKTKHTEELRISLNKLSVMRGHEIFAHAKTNDDAKLIMRACNSHADLLEALASFSEWISEIDVNSMSDAELSLLAAIETKFEAISEQAIKKSIE